jgi:hypothetical protein
MQALQSKRQAKKMRSGDGSSDGESTSGGEDDESDADSVQGAAGGGAGGAGARATSILIGAPVSPQQQKKARTVSPKEKQQQTQLFALVGTQCKCLMGHKMVVLATELVSKMGDGSSAFQCSM